MQKNSTIPLRISPHYMKITNLPEIYPKLDTLLPCCDPGWADPAVNSSGRLLPHTEHLDILFSWLPDFVVSCSGRMNCFDSGIVANQYEKADEKRLHFPWPMHSMKGNGLKNSRHEPGDAKGWPPPSACRTKFWRIIFEVSFFGNCGEICKEMFV